MSTHHKQGWTALKAAEGEFRTWATANGIAVETVEHVATFEDWDKRTEVYVFFPTHADLERHTVAGTLSTIEARYRELLSDAAYPSERFPVHFYFDSHENVVKNYQGSYFYRLR